MSTELVEKIKNVGELYKGKPWSEVLRIQHDLISEFLSHADEPADPISRILNDPSSSFFTLDIILKMIEISNNEKFVPGLIQFLTGGGDRNDDLCGRVSDLLFNYGDLAAPQVIKKLEEDFGKKVYNGWLVDTLNGVKAGEFAEKILNDFLANQTHYEGWFNLGHFVWASIYSGGNKEGLIRLIEKLLELKNLYREDRLELKRAHRSLTDEEGYQKEVEREEKESMELTAGLLLAGVLNSRLGELVQDGPRPVIDEGNLNEYLPLLHSIERLIFGLYEKNPSLKDGDVMELLKDIRDRIWGDYEGKNELEKKFIIGLKLGIFSSLAELNYTKGEASACISRVLNSVKRHREPGCERSYLDFIKDVFKGERRETEIK